MNLNRATSTSSTKIATILQKKMACVAQQSRHDSKYPPMYIYMYYMYYTYNANNTTTVAYVQRRKFS